MRFLFLAWIFFQFLSASASWDNLLQTGERDENFFKRAQDLDLNSAQTTVDLKEGTSSVGLKILSNENYWAYWYPLGNVTAQVEGQVVSYNLARYFKINHLVAPSTYLEIRGAPLKVLIEKLEALDIDPQNTIKRQNVATVLLICKSALALDQAVLGALIDKMDKFEPNGLVNWQQSLLNVSHPLAKMIRADQPHPSSYRIYDLPDFENEDGVINLSTELDLARELSQLFVLDMLAGQEDRFSGGNVEARFDFTDSENKLGGFHFLFRDNGGAHLEYGSPQEPMFQYYLSIVSRFDRDQIAKVQQLLTLLQNNPDAVRDLLQMKTNTFHLQERAAALLKQVDELVKKYGEEKVFFHH